MTQHEELSIFSGLTPDNIENITKDLKRISFKKGEAIISEHAEGDNLFYIDSGKVEISKDIENDDNLFARLSVLGPGDVFGEMSLINDAPRSASAVALEDVELMVMPREVFMDITFTHPIVMFNLIRTLSGRLRDTNEKFIELMNQMISKNRLMAIGMAASKIIHDIKSPFTVIVLTAQLIENQFPDAAEHTKHHLSNQAGGPDGARNPGFCQGNRGAAPDSADRPASLFAGNKEHLWNFSEGTGCGANYRE
jgi:CRP-like cAMP-binding protein